MGSYSQETLDALAALEAIFGPPDEDGPPKWSFEALFAHLAACGVPREIIWRQICHIMNLTIIPIITSSFPETPTQRTEGDSSFGKQTASCMAHMCLVT